MKNLSLIPAIAIIMLIACSPSPIEQKTKEQAAALSTQPLTERSPAITSPSLATLRELPLTQNWSILESDYQRIKTLAEAQQNKIIALNQGVIAIAHSKDTTALKQHFPKFSALLTQFNQQLQAVPLHNQDVKALRDKMIAANKLSIDMMAQSLSSHINSNRLMAFFEQSAVIQKDLINLDLKVQNQLYTLHALGHVAPFKNTKP